LKCNCRCLHCAAAAGKARNDELTTAEALNVCDQIGAMSIPSVCLMGGEALLRKDWERISLRLRERGVPALGLVTNGIALNEIIWRKLEILGFVQLVVSLDAINEQTHDRRRRRKGACAAAKTAICEMMKRPLEHRTVVTSVDRTTFDQLPAIRDWLVEFAPGITWMVNYSSPVEGSRMSRENAFRQQDFLALARFLAHNRKSLRGTINVTGTHGMGYFSTHFPDLHDHHWSGCQAGLTTSGILSNGDVNGCLIMGHRLVEGNLRTRTLKDIWNDPKAFAYNRRFTAKQLTGACRNCAHGSQCKGGCRQIALSYTGRFFEAPFCLHRLEGSKPA
jgi:radical SAM protein with 4Fe4S-binding SPASM domain